MGEAPDQPLRFHNEAKRRKQMRKRGVTEAMVRAALAVPGEPWSGKLGPAWRHRDPVSGAGPGRSVHRRDLPRRQREVQV